MSKVEIKDSDIAILLAAIQNSVAPVQVGPSFQVQGLAR